MQGSDHTLHWNGSRYILAWLQILRGRIYVVSASLDPERASFEEYRALTEEPATIEDAPRTRPQLLPGASGRTLVLWSSERAVFRLWLDGQGRPISAPEVVIEQALFSRVLRTEEGYLMLSVPLGSAGRTRLSAHRLDEEARLVEGPTTVLNSRALAWATYSAEEGLTLLWSVREAGGDDFVYLSSRTSRLEPAGEDRLIYEGENAAGRYLGPTKEPAVAVVWDFEQGSALIDLKTTEVLMRLNQGRFDNLSILHEPGGERLALLHEVGEYESTNPLSNRLEYQAVDYSTQRAGPMRLIDDGGPRGDCLEEAHMVTRSVDVPEGGQAVRLGVSWVMGCTERRLFFTELSAEVQQ